MSTDVDIRFFSEVMPGRRAEILDAALCVFGEHGYEGGSMRQIAEHVGISQPALYRHFAGKEDLFLTIIEQAGLRLHSEIEPAFADMDPAMLADVLDVLLGDHRQFIRDRYVSIIKTILIASAYNPRFLDAYRDSIMRPLVKHLSHIVPALDAHFGVASSPEDLEQRVQTVISVFIGYMLMTFVFESEASPIADTIIRIMQWQPS